MTKYLSFFLKKSKNDCLLQEFYLPLKSAGLLNAEQISTIFGNLLELITVNERFTDQLQDALDMAAEEDDEVTEFL